MWCRRPDDCCCGSGGGVIPGGRAGNASHDQSTSKSPILCLVECIMHVSLIYIHLYSNCKAGAYYKVLNV